MQTRTLEVAAIEEAAVILRGGGLVAFPTETVYGLGALGLDPAAVERIFIAKGRPPSDPLILHVAEPEGVRDLVQALPPAAERLIGAFWPGPLTLVLPRSERVPDRVTAGLASVAVRMPAHPVALELIRRVGAPLAAPSANLFSRPSPTTAAHVLEDLNGSIDAVLDGGSTRVGLESTVVDLCGEVPRVLRPGGVVREALEQALGTPVWGPSAQGPASGEEDAEEEARRSPGLLTRHYSPRADVRLYEGPDAAVLQAIRRFIQDAARSVPVGVLAYLEDLPSLRDLPATLVDLGSRSEPEEVARSLYAAMRRLDEEGVSLLVARTMPPGGLGEALNDRLRRAASGQIYEV